MKYNKNIVNKNMKKLLVLSLSAAVCLSSVACSSSDKRQASRATIERKTDFSDVRMAKIIGPQQAMLKYTTANKSASIISLELKKADGKFVYILSAMNKDKLNQILTIDAASGKILKTENKGPTDPKTSFMDFATTLDIKDAIEKSTPYTKDPNINIVESYSMYNESGKNLYKLNFTNAAEKEDELKTKTIIIDAETGKEFTKNDKQNSEEEANDNQNTGKSETNKTTTGE